MKKYLAVLFIFFSFGLFFSPHFASLTFANHNIGVNGEGCRPDGIPPGGTSTDKENWANQHCSAGLACEWGQSNPTQEDTGYRGKCIGKAPELECKCVKEGETNAFKCDTSATTASCTEDEVCINTPGQNVEPKNNPYPNKPVLKGVRCTLNPVATCKCQNPGKTKDGQNHFDCTRGIVYKPGAAGNKEGHCSGGQACNNVEGGTTGEDDIFDNATLKGITCAKPAKPTLPPPPSPPCLQWTNGQCTQVGTALGGVSTDPAGFITKLFAVLLSFSGGIALLLIMRSGYNMMTSQGKPEQLNNARDQLVAAIVGLVFLICSFLVLQIIGFDILRIPGFGGSAAQGATCDPNATNPCDAGLSCVYNGRSGTCQGDTRIPRNGTCNPSGPANQCGAGLSCQYTGSGGQCR